MPRVAGRVANGMILAKAPRHVRLHPPLPHQPHNFLRRKHQEPPPALRRPQLRRLSHDVKIRSLETENRPFTVLGGPSFFYPFDDIQNSLFVSGGFGVNLSSVRAATATTTTSITDWALGWELGKRFKLFDHVSYRPTVGMVKVHGSDWVLNFVPLSGSIHF